MGNVLGVLGAAAARTAASHYTAKKLIAIVVTLGVAVLASGFLIPIVARGRAKSLAAQADRKEGAEQDKLRAKAQRAQRASRQSVLGVLLGYDGRLSTSKTMAALWTLVVAYILIALIPINTVTWPEALKHLNWTYLSLLGGPYAALALAKGAVSYRVNKGTQQKTEGDGIPRLSDLVGDDSGKPDLFDVQYVMFNLIAMGFVLRAFWGATLGGFPTIPSGLILLTGGPAAVYLSNKVLGSNAAVILTVAPSAVRPGDPFTIYGQNFEPSAPPAAGSTAAGDGAAAAPAAPTVEVGGVAGTVTSGWTNSAISARAPTDGVPMGTPLGVSVVTSGGQRALLDAALTILGPPRVDGADKATAAAGDRVTLSGQWSLAGGPTVVILVDGVVAGLVDAAHPGTATFLLPQLDQPLPRSVQVVVVVGGQRSEEIPLQVTA